MNIVANVSRVNGEVYALRGNEKILLQVGSPLTDDDTVITEDSSLEITFTDKTQVTLSEDTEIMISDYVFTPSDESFLLSITKGTMQSISGEIVKRNPEAFEIQSPKATMGIRGTTTLHTVSDNGDENHVVLSISDGHTVHINSASGSFALLTSSSEGVVIGAGGTAITPFVLSTSELNEIIQIMNNMDNPQEVLQQLNVKLKQVQDNEDISTTESQNLQAVTEAIDNMTQEGKQLSVVTEEVVAPINDAELISEESQDANTEEEGEGLAKEFADSSKSTTEKENAEGSTSQKSQDIDSSQSSQAQSSDNNDSMLLIPSVPEPTPDPSLGTTSDNPIIVNVTPKNSGDIYFTPKNETEIILGHFEHDEKFIVEIESLPEDFSYSVHLTDTGFLFKYDGLYYSVNWQDDDILVDNASTNQVNQLSGVVEFDFGNTEHTDLNYSVIWGKGPGSEAKLTNGNDTFYLKDGYESFNSNGKEYSVTHFNTIDMGSGDNDIIFIDADDIGAGEEKTVRIDTSTNGDFYVSTSRNSNDVLASTIFENFEKIHISDSGASEGFKIQLSLQGQIDNNIEVSYTDSFNLSTDLQLYLNSNIWSQAIGEPTTFKCNNGYTLTFVQAP